MRLLLLGLSLSVSCAPSSPDRVGHSSAGEPAAGSETRTEPTASPELSSSSRELADRLNQYRAELGLAAVPVSRSLMAVAEAHARDLEENQPVTEQCNFHSWSSVGRWSSCCYTSDHGRAQCMWDKPRELTNYPGNGYEIAAGGTAPMTVETAVRLWNDSSAHREVIVNGGAWTDEWGAMGAAVHGRYAVAWFGHERE